MTEYGTKECKHCHKSFKGLAFYNHTCIKGSLDEELFGEPGNPDYTGTYPGEARWIGQDKVMVKVVDETEPDEMWDHSDDQGYDIEEEA